MISLEPISTLNVEGRVDDDFIQPGGRIFIGFESAQTIGVHGLHITTQNLGEGGDISLNVGLVVFGRVGFGSTVNQAEGNEFFVGGDERIGHF